MLTQQLERIPMDRELRAEVSAGIERLNDSSLQNKPSAFNPLWMTSPNC